jgi:ppGpp synthetase/RelA/SpoT-type nucleotidyltranferase
MNQNEVTDWLAIILPKHNILLPSVTAVTESLLRASNLDFLSVAGRVKTLESAVEKIKRKGYSDPARQMTDITGVRIIVFFESQVDEVSKIITDSFAVDASHSSDKKNILKVNQNGYRSVHFVCDLGAERSKLPEYEGLGGLKFEFQVRTVLQHAWAELAHDGSYKFSGKLPTAVERKLFLYAGMLELADRGFDELAKEIEDYKAEVNLSLGAGNLDMEVNSINLVEFISAWAEENKINIDLVGERDAKADLVEELRTFGVASLAQLKELIPSDYAVKAREYGVKTTIYGVVRDWMLISDWRAYHGGVKYNWELTPFDDLDLLRHYLKEDVSEFESKFSGGDYNYGFEGENTHD